MTFNLFLYQEESVSTIFLIYLNSESCKKFVVDYGIHEFSKLTINVMICVRLLNIYEYIIPTTIFYCIRLL